MTVGTITAPTDVITHVHAAPFNAVRVRGSSDHYRVMWIPDGFTREINFPHDDIYHEPGTVKVYPKDSILGALAANPIEVSVESFAIGGAGTAEDMNVITRTIAGNAPTSPTVPVSAFPNPEEGDGIIESYDDRLLAWEYTGGLWVLTVTFQGGSKSLPAYNNIDEDDATYSYYGWSDYDGAGSWLVRRYVKATGIHADALTGAADYATAWNSRTTLTYS